MVEVMLKEMADEQETAGVYATCVHGRQTGELQSHTCEFRVALERTLELAMNTDDRESGKK